MAAPPTLAGKMLLGFVFAYKRRPPRASPTISARSRSSRPSSCCALATASCRRRAARSRRRKQILSPPGETEPTLSLGSARSILPRRGQRALARQDRGQLDPYRQVIERGDRRELRIANARSSRRRAPRIFRYIRQQRLALRAAYYDLCSRRTRSTSRATRPCCSKAR